MTASPNTSLKKQISSSSFLFALLLLVAPLTSYAERRPNIIVILADDLGCGDLSLYNGWVKTPRIDKMAREGMNFTDFHTNSSVCSPTRTAFLTGRYQQRYGIVDVIVGAKDTRGLLPSVPTIPRAFKDKGYQTAIFGKWHLGHADKYNPIHHGFDEYIGFLNGGSDYHVHNQWKVGLKTQDVPGYSTDLITNNSVDFIKRNKDKPFFLYVSHAAVHNPYQTPADKPETRTKRRWNRVNESNRPRYKIILEEMDKGVGEILDTLVELGLDKNTLVFFFSDNGDVKMSPQERPYRGGKFSQFEGGHRVPAIAWWPGKVKAGSESDAFIIGMDLFPTFTEIAGLSDSNPDNLDGISAKAHILEQKAFPQRDIFFGYEPKLGTAMRRGDWKMIVKENDIQLYDLKNDLKETTNVASKHPHKAEQMHKAIKDFKITVIEGS
ncbi:MAG: sulfatase-like hydrolase/transferase [Verrucomicrobiae bacterium]|nr:sulfatase-like hydrolase/transferase [Verrucomicrobiae bacterium]NNJ43284.1 sulfatase-like hydrolase/transferase [Akkermansiaceae bacterium]